MMEKAIDYSGHQTPTNTILLARLADPLVTTCFIKATEGLTVDASFYPVHVLNARDAHKRVAAYHFGWPNQNPVEEVDHFLKVANLKPGMGAVLDMENWGELDTSKPNYARDKAMRDATPWSQRIAYTLVWLREVKKRTGATPAVYMNWYWIQQFRKNATLDQWAELCTYPLWLADYDFKAGQFPTVDPKVPGGITMTVWVHQYTTNGGTFDDDVVMAPELWEKYSVPFTLEDIVAQILTDLAKLAENVGRVIEKLDTKISPDEARSIAEEVISEYEVVSTLVRKVTG